MGDKLTSNKNSSKYGLFERIRDNWPLDDWSINVECFEKIVEILDFGKTILELGSGKSTQILSNFYNMISVEDNEEFLNKYNSNYISVRSETGATGGYDFAELKDKLGGIEYDLLIIDGPNDNREKIIDYINDFNTDVPIIFDDTQVYEEHAIALSNKIGKKYETIQCKPLGSFWRDHSNGKRFTLIR